MNNAWWLADRHPDGCGCLAFFALLLGAVVLVRLIDRLRRRK